MTSTTRRLVDRCLKGHWCIALEAEQLALKLNQGESQSVDSARTSAKAKSAFLSTEDPNKPAAGKTLHKSASMTFGDSCSGTGGATGLTRAPSKKGAGTGLQVKHTGATPDAPRSADPASGSRTFAHHHPDRAQSVDDVEPRANGIAPPVISLAGLSLDDRPDSVTNIPTSTSNGSSVAVAITAATPVIEKPPPDPTRQRSGSVTTTKRDKNIPPPPRPPRKNSDGTFKPPPTRTNSVGEVSKLGVGSGDRVAGAGGLAAPQVLKEGAGLLRSAPPTPPPKRRKAPPVPGVRKSTMTTIASSSGGASVGLGVPVR